MVNFTILAGGYSSSIVSYLFNTNTSALTYAGETQTAPNPSWLITTKNALGRDVIYATHENENGTLATYANLGGVLSLVDSVSSGGNGPVHCAPLTSGDVVVTNYGSGNGLVASTAHDGYDLTQTSNVVTFTAPEGGLSHPHMALEYNSEVLVPDLGADTIWRLGKDNSSNSSSWSIHGALVHDKGSGPRHIVVYEDILYTLHELTNTLTAERLPNVTTSTTASQLLGNVTIVPSDTPANATRAAAELLLAPPFLFASNRHIDGENDPRGDSIAVFDQFLNLQGHVFTGLQNIRGMQFGGNNNEWLVALGAVSGGMVVYHREGGSLTEVARNGSAIARTSAVIINAATNLRNA
ncbi:putative isomerase YbhE [Cylindrobasidium torrendii FP15055 ss-10]|uniref:Putative isomerase YbhE n=1 Tax=Cylindrobasidium torrendii FP15055 ss-10 TaxID=1314674 RepID=A0A0D7BF65_9AGAR|nr:putative isomerase YbhE [Cylindrobasidium torrendii FP15055 ss-10]